jgi:chromosome segregation ATPase
VERLESELAETKKELKSQGQRQNQIDRDYRRGKLEVENYNRLLAGFEEDKTQLEEYITQLEQELIRAKDTATRTEKRHQIRQLWDSLKVLLEKFEAFDEWPEDLAQGCKFDIIHPTFSAIYVKEPEGGSPRGWHLKKLNPELSFEYRF